jgi:hypothetical protein
MARKYAPYTTPTYRQELPWKEARKPKDGQLLTTTAGNITSKIQQVRKAKIKPLVLVINFHTSPPIVEWLPKCNKWDLHSWLYCNCFEYSFDGIPEPDLGVSGNLPHGNRLFHNRAGDFIHSSLQYIHFVI